jgi:CRISPR type IV-associated protein Csf3
MQPLKIVATMATSIVVFDDWSPALDSLLEWLILDKLHLTSPNPTPEQVEASRAIVDREMPLAKGEIMGEWYWQISSPCYRIVSEYTDKFRKRWDFHDSNLNWNKRKAKWSTSEGGEKSYDLPLYCRNTPSITWYGVGDREAFPEGVAAGIANLLQDCTHLGKKRSYGNGQVLRWEVEPIKEDWHLWREGKLMRPMPYRLLFSYPEILNNDPVLMNWGWRPPAWLPSNKEVCVMPKENVWHLTTARA